jgi:flagella synthesis protein FlgN
MTPNKRMQRLLVGLRDDLADYRRLRDLLDAQFAAALKHRADEIRDVVTRILEVTAVLEGRRRERVELVGLLLAGETAAPPMQALSARLPAAIRKNYDAGCAALELRLRECKRLNRRNCHVLTAQHDIMRQVLDPEGCIYGPG